METRSSALFTGKSSPADLAGLTARLDALEGHESRDRVAALLALAMALPSPEAERQDALADEAYALASQIDDAAGMARAAGIKGRAL